ncbi:type I polyketide synthase [Aetokthonos hydrillicola]|uniref:type I polyketide synthase n=1 Tax=Aetokthonos hydrillicola TaxID=1550245 RepID=UPI001ABAFC36|nr:type I polyketide synthase [Aetokthonos hydrillicola]MBO3463553.1 SDR family NAD(P)-dependent oxidoreductase [Aetokthonos hydrillicola CCALA 1050]
MQQPFSSQQSFELLEQVNNKLEAVDRETTEPIAIIGIACRFPGAKDYDEFWQNLEQGINSISEIPAQRWDVEKYYSANPETPNKTISKWSGLIEDIDKFDAQFFGISPREATRMDPQQRIMLELSWSCIEDAGYAASELSGSQVGVFIGACNYDYNQLQQQNENIEGHSATGSYTCIIPNRISYFFNFHGPSVPVDTACSSSLVALHQAVNSINEKECEIALVGGISVLCTPSSYISFSQLGMLSPKGECKSFDSEADGYVRGEGAGVVLLKPLAKALLDQDRIYGVIKGSAVNHGGKARTLTSPNVYAQAQVLRAAYTKANIAPNTVSYIETHGTGTPLGDPIEINGLKRSFKQLHQQNQVPLPEKPYCGLGAVKTNIGHLEAAAGIAGLITVLLAIKHKKLPKIANFEQLNPRIDLKDSPFYIVSETQEWQHLKTETGEVIPRRAGVSSFGFGGVNAHVVLEEPPETVKSEEHLERPQQILTLCAQTEKALRELAKKYETYLQSNTEASIQDICFSANTGRTDFAERLAIVANSRSELQEKLTDFLQDNQTKGVVRGKAESQHKKLAFLFTGQGSQYVDMGRQLYETQPTFRKIIDQCNAILEKYLEIPLLDLLYPEQAKNEVSSLIDQTAYTQPALFAIEYALAKLWESWGIKPDVVMGHSVGEYVAASVAGVFSLEDGLKLIAMRGRLMQQLPNGGQMVSVMASESQVTEAIGKYTSQVTIAAINGPESIVISGESEAIIAICRKLEGIEVKTKQLQVSHAFHSPLMGPMLTEFEALALEVTYSQPKIPLISNVTGQKVGLEITKAEYWVEHVRQPVRFAQSMKTLHELGYELFLEIGPKPILLGMGRQCLPEEVGVWLPSLRPGVEEWQQMLSSLGQLYVQGVKVNWSEFDKHYTRQKVALPTYPFQRESYWIETNNNQYQKKRLGRAKILHPLLGEKQHLAGLENQERFESFLAEDEPVYLSHHRVFDKALFPTTAYLEIALAAGLNQFKTSSLLVENLVIGQGLILPAGVLKTVQTILTPLDNKTYQFQIFTQHEQENQEELLWVLHASGKIQPLEIDTAIKTFDLEKYLSQCTQRIEVKQHYQECQQIGIDYGTSFQGMQKLWRGSNQAIAQIKLPQELVAEITDYQFHPALLDAALQVIFHALPDEITQTYLPIGINQLKVYDRPGLSLWSYASVTQPLVESEGSLTTQVTLVNGEGEIIATVEGLRLKKATPLTLLGTENDEAVTNWFYEVEWRTKGQLGRLLPPDYLLEPVEVEQQLSSTVTELATQVDDHSSKEILTQLEQLSVEYVVEALQEMGWSYQPGEYFSLDSATQRLGIVPSQQRLFNRILQILAEVGIVKETPQQWQTLQTLEQVNPNKNSQTLLSQYPNAVAELTLLNRCGSQLSGVLRGTQDPVQLVFPEGDLTTATQLYQESPAAQVMNTLVQKAISKAIEKLPQQRGMRLLEIGAGTGGTTSYILPHLPPNQTEYVFTDIGALFTTKAQEKFRDYPFVRYQTLDIELDPVNQGFEKHQYDVIIAANVLHATTSLRQTLSHVQKLLAPGGMLVLLEATTRTRWVDLIFGLLEGWWKFQDHELRPDYPLLSRSNWKQLLSETGYTQVVSMPEMDGMPETLSHQAVIIAKAAETTLEAISSEQKNWLILADTQGVAQHLATQLRSVGELCTLVFTGKQYQQIAPEEFTINPHNLEEFELLVAQVAPHPDSLFGVVQCWTTEAGERKNINSQELEDLSQLGCGTTLSLVQALVKGGLSKLPRLWLVTSGAQPVSATHPLICGLAQSSVWGMGKVISLEHPELKCVRIDLDPQQTLEHQALALFSEIWSEDFEDQVAFRGDGRYVARLVGSRHTPAQTPLRFRQNCTYLITGGLGGLGLLVARWMVSRGAKHLVLVGRRSPDDAVLMKLTELEQAGALVVVEKADVSEWQSIARVVSRINQSTFPLAGVIHSAGMLSDGILQNQSWSSFEQVMAPKVQGAWHLHQLTQNQSLDFFVLFSSAASLLGSPGQANHSAANAFLDGLAHYRRAMGLAGLSIHWGAVSQVGEAAERGADIRLQQKGMGAISPPQMLEALELLINSSGVEVGVVPIEWSAWSNRVAEWSFLVDWKHATQTPESSPSEFLLHLEAYVPSERQEMLVAHVRRHVAEILGLTSSI